MGVVRGAGWLTAIAGVLLALTMWVLTTGAQAQYLSLPGSLSVSPNGAATYSIPIQVPPGTSGMVPSLSLDYNSQGGNGIVGLGWSLGGLPQITRCPRTKAQDGYFRGVYYDTGDAYCLDGQRLVLTAGAPGAHGAEYRTEIDGFSRITAHNGEGYAPLYFKVQTKAGQTMYLGSSAGSNSRLYAEVGKIVSWHIDRIEDAANNTIHFFYRGSEPGETGRYRIPDKITYGGNYGNRADYAGVKFVYSTTPPKYMASRFANGYEFATVPKLLKEIVTYVKVNGQNKVDPTGTELEVDSYRLHYLEDEVLWTNKLHAVVHCRPSGQGLPMTGGLTAAEGGQPCVRTDFDWSTGSDSAGAIWMPDQDIGGGGNISAERYSLIAADFNADGFTDLLRAGNDNGGPNDTSSRLYLARSADGANSDKGEFFYSGAWLSGYNAKDHTILPGGWLGRAKPTILTVENDKYGGSGYEYHRLQFFEYGGGAFSSIGGVFTLNKQPFHSSGNVLDYESWGSGDFNGDGLQDLTHWEVEHDPDGSNSKDYRFQVWLNRASATGEPTGFASFSQADFSVQQVNVQSHRKWPVTPVVGDFNGDGKDDLIVNFLDKTHTGLHIYRSDGTSFSALDNDYGEIGNAIYTGDFNGDGLPDLLGVRTNQSILDCATNPYCYRLGYAFSPDYNDTLTYDVVRIWLGTGARPGQNIEFVAQPYHYVIGGRATTQPRADGSLKAPDWDIVIGDFNGTGRTGFALIPTCERDTSCNHNAEFYASVGVGFRQVPPLTRAAYSGYAIIMGDWTGVGTTGFLRQPKKGGSQYPGPSNVVKHNWTKPARSEIVKITTALGEETMIESKPLTDDTVYGTFGNYDYPEVRITAPIYVVSAVEASTAGVTPTYYRSEYFYENAVVDQLGRGFLGFRKKKSTDVQTGISQTTTYAQGFPFTGMVTKVEKHLNDTILLSETTNTLESLPAVPVVGYPVFPYVSQTVADSWDLETDVAHPNGTGTLIPMPRTISTYQYDWYGNATRVATSVPGGTKSVTLNTYSNDIGPNWHLGRLVGSEVTKTDLSQ